MFEWKVEKMALMNQVCATLASHGEKIYKCEPMTAREDKIAFVDSMQEGKLSYLLFLIDKFNADKDRLPKKESGFGGSGIKTVPLKAWIKRNDTRYPKKMIDDRYWYGKYTFLGVDRYIQTNRKGEHETYEDLVSECFHRQLKICEEQERAYFSAHDEYSVLKKKVREKAEEYHTTFGMPVVFSGGGGVLVGDGGNGKREITVEELRGLLDKYGQVDALIERLTVGE